MNKLIEWKEKLLDVSRKNKLINFKETKEGPVELLAPNYDVIYNTLVNEGGYFLYDPLNKTEEKLDRQAVIDSYANDLKKDQVLAYFSKEKVSKVLKQLSKNVNEYLDEKGVNILFVSFGILEYIDKEDKKVLRAPILLLPVKLYYDNKELKYVIEKIDDYDENITLVKKLNDDYHMSLPSFEKTKNITKYFDALNKVVSKENFKVYYNVYISTFSYYKINMFEDLTKNSKQVLANDNIKRLISDDKIKIERNPLDYSSLQNVVAADSSQNEAVALSASGRSFVLQGPPGTGKSQTITNIIAKALNDNKKVLFVSEKMAAIQVVEDNLIEAKLGDYVLNMHSSSKKDKGNIIKNIYDALNKPKVAINKDIAESTKANYKKTCDLIDEYNKNLYSKVEKRESSIFEYCLFASKYYKNKDVLFVIDEIENKDDEYVRTITDDLSQYVEMAKLIGSDYRKNPFYGFDKSNIDYKSLPEFKEELNKYLENINSLYALSFEIENSTGILLNNYEAIINNQKLFDILSKQDDYFISLFNDDGVYEKLVELRNNIKEEKSLHNQFDNLLTDDILDVDDKTLNAIVDSKNLFTRIFSKKYKDNKKEVSKTFKNRASYLRLSRNLKKVLKYKEIYAKDNQLLNDISNKISSYYKERETNFDYLIDLFDNVKPLLNENNHYEILFNNSNEEIKNLSLQYLNDLLSFIDKTKDFMKNINNYFDETLFNFNTALIIDIKNKTKSMIENFDGIYHYIDFLKFLPTLKENKLDEYIATSFDNENFVIEDLIGSYLKIYYTQLIHYLIKNNEVLDKTTNSELNHLYDEFDRLDKAMLEINVAEIIEKCSNNKPAGELISSGSPLALLKREAEKKRFQMPIRALMANISSTIQEIKPCFLMSPLSVCTYFIDSPDTFFDLIIFDEASQIFPEDAIGVIYRGKQLIVVGDSKQMPPSNFFNSQNVSEEKTLEDEDNIMAYESILDLCASRFDSSRLDYHYRSRFEDLIAFSNEFIYSKMSHKLMTFPSALVKKQYLGIDFYKVEDGIFDSLTRSNEKEAIKVVDLIVDHIENNKDRSLGVIAFGIGQQKAIEKELNSRMRNNPSLKEFVYAEVEEPFFIKNLETVQGNERDTIILSVGYSKDKTGSLKFTFGPLTKEGGERRLNVAITRAKYNVALVSSIEAKDFVTETSTQGVLMLKGYLEYAKDHNIFEKEKLIDDNVINLVDRYNYIKDEIKDFLEENGYDVELNVGYSDYPVDIAVKLKEGNTYVLAIDVDSEKFRKLKAIRDFSTRKIVLKRLGWHYIKLNAIEWIKNPNGEKKALLKLIKKSIGSEVNIPTIDLGNMNILQEIEGEESFKEYVNPDYALLMKNYKKDKNFSTLIHSILETCAPISKDDIIKNILPIFNSTSVTSRVRVNFDALLDTVKSIKVVDDFIFEKYSKVVPLRINKENPRHINDIAIEEIAGGIYKIILVNNEVNEEGIIKTLIDEIGYKRNTETIENRIKEAIKLLKKNGYIMVDDNLYSIKKKKEIDL